MRTSSFPRIFDPNHPDQLGYLLVLTRKGYWLVPAERGGWAKRAPCAPRAGGNEFQPTLAAEWWALLTGQAIWQLENKWF